MQTIEGSNMLQLIGGGACSLKQAAYGVYRRQSMQSIEGAHAVYKRL